MTANARHRDTAADAGPRTASAAPSKLAAELLTLRRKARTQLTRIKATIAALDELASQIKTHRQRNTRQPAPG